MSHAHCVVVYAAFVIQSPARIYAALNTLHLSWSQMIFGARWGSRNRHRVGYENYLHHALTEYIKQ